MGSRGVSLVVALVCCALVWVGAQAVAGGSAAARSEATATARAWLALTATPSRTGTTVPPTARRLERIGAFGGINSALVLSGTLAFVGEGEAVAAYDLSDTAVPRRVGSVPLPGVARSLLRVGTMLLVGHDAGLTLVNSAAPARMSVLSQFLTERVVDLEVVGQFAYLFTTTSLRIVNIADPSRPIVMGVPRPFGAIAAASNGTTLYLLTYSQLLLLDVSDPANPRLQSSLYTPSPAYDMASVGTTLLLGGDGKLRLVDVADPLEPVFVGAYNTGRGQYVAVEAVGTRAYALRAFGPTTMVEMLDISAPLSPTLQSSAELPMFATSLAVEGSRVYVGEREGITVVESATVPPTLLGRVMLSSLARQLVVDSSFVYVMGSQTLTIYPTGDAANPAALGQYVTPYFLGNLVVHNGVAYIAAGNDGGLLIVGVGDGRNPTLLGRYLTIGNVAQIALAGNLAYVADGFAGLLVLDISNPARPTVRGRLTGISLYSVIVAGTTVYGTGGNGQLVAIDVSNPAQPVLVASDTQIDAARLYAIDNNMLYVGSFYSSGVNLIDIRQPTAPRLLTRLLDGVFVQSLTVADGLAYVMTRESVLVYDVTQPLRPFLVGEHPENLLFGGAIGMGVAGDRVYVPANERGTVVLRFDRSQFRPSSVLLPVVVQQAPPASPTAAPFAPTTTPCAGCPPTATAVIPTRTPFFQTPTGSATITPCAGCPPTATVVIPTRTPCQPGCPIDLTINVADNEPLVGESLLTYGDLIDYTGNGVPNMTISVTYSYNGGSGQWCSATTDTDGYWECNGSVTAAMAGKEVRLVAEAAISNGQVREELLFTAR